jgi:thioredoxin-related protein
MPSRCRLLAVWMSLVLLPLASAAAEDILWLADVDQACEMAARDRRPILVYVKSANCPHCQRMDQKTFSDPQLAAEIDQTWIAVKIDPQRHAEFIKANEITAFPTLLVVSPDMIEFDRVKGFRTSAQVHKRLDSARRAILAEEGQTLRR